MTKDELPRWLDPAWSLEQESNHDAKQVYLRFVVAGIGMANPINSVRHQLLLGDDDFVASHQCRPQDSLFREVAKVQRRATVMSLPEYQAKYPQRDLAMAQAYLSTAYTMAQIAEHFRVSYRTVSRVVHRVEKN
jgi:putative transposase